jgi:glutathione S-transferase
LECRLEKSRAQRIVWLLEELNLEYELKVFKRDANMRAGDDLKAVHPLGKSPVIGITPAGSEKEIIVAESETIVEYVCEHFGRHMIPQRYPEGKEGVLGAENENWMKYKVCSFRDLRDWSLREVISLPSERCQLV